jgi:hypothetical protein
MHPFREAIQNKDIEAMKATLAEDVQFFSPVAFRPFDGRDSTVGVLLGVMSTFEDFNYTDELVEGPTTTLIFEARVGDKKIQGLDLLRHNDAGEIEQFTVMLRPLSALMAMNEAMTPKVEGLAKGDAPV